MSGTASGPHGRTERGVPYYRSLDSGLLVSGCERTPFGLTVGAGVGPCFVSFFALMGGYFLVSLFAGLIGATVLIGGIYTLRRMAKKDPFMTRVYLRNRKYKNFYPARSTPACKR